MADPKAQAGENSVSDGDLHKSIPVGVDTIAALLQSLTVGINGLVKRVDALEQSQGIAHGTKHSKKDTGNNEPTRDKNESGTTTVTTTGTTSAKHDEDENSMGENQLRLVEYRKKVYLDHTGKFDWKILSADADQKTASGRVSFRYDTDENGKLALLVFRSANIFDWLLDECPPAADGQVNLLPDGLVFEDAFPLLHLRPNLDAYYEEKLVNDEPHNPLHKRTVSELKAFMELYDRGKHFKDAKMQYERMRETGQIDFHSLKGLFHRDQLVVFRELRDELAVARVTMITATDENDRYGRDVKLDLDCKAIDFDGKKFRYHLYRKTIDVFTGSRNITELEVYPLDYSHEKEDIINKSIDSGKKWWDLHEKLTEAHGQSRAAVMHYDGYCETFGENARDENGGKGSQLVTRVIVDTTRFPDRFLRFTEEDVPSPDKDLKSFASEDEGNPYVLCPERVLVHSLSDNEWYYVAMTRLVNPVWDSKAWKTLVKPHTYTNDSDKDDIAKSIDRIQKLAQAHKAVTKKDERMDNFKGKGKGLTFLLHGPPGVGKTMLAECLSEDQERPLYRINLGRLIAEANWESKIDEIFRQAHSWDAILLVDEAEVILAERTQENMEQSAWVAVFLRKIEYFEGIIFLTTNLIHMIDPAFISRVNLGFRIPAMDFETRLDIWKTMLKNLPDTTDTQLLSPDDWNRWAQFKLNGRQIRNVIHSARLLGNEPMSGVLTVESIDDAINDAVNFMKMIEGEKKDMELRTMSHWS